MSGIHACTTAGIFFGVTRMGCAVGAQEKARVIAGRSGHECFAIRLGLEDRQAVEVRADAAAEDLVAVVEQMLWRDRGANAGAGMADEIDGGGCRDVLEDHFQRRMSINERRQNIIDKPTFAIEHVDRVGRDFAVHLQDESELRHRG